ncbi:hypothetical protein XFF6166_520096 [Xanthomonas citri pv. fuscans]|nr:hypothetical protein XFF6166_520096 [Xanthomonas citri pv. fuscans]SOO01493.1 hypothetical protein XFF6960_480121 [Xanthomonas citri pv. fuscans]SOO03651.1 hypothetical protein XFF7767_180012 [Xanthomonas citri pv. fuscans]SOO10059.1 hypothetical protein XFF6970_490194 [Xanthomonas citri pv. fuscans]SOO14034.1 hypothetical protein XFF7766_260137 [Xanthomonas citri pv. fuscans]
MPRATHRPYDATAAWVVRILILPSGTFSPMKEDNVPTGEARSQVAARLLPLRPDGIRHAMACMFQPRP